MTLREAEKKVLDAAVGLHEDDFFDGPRPDTMAEDMAEKKTVEKNRERSEDHR